MKAESIAFMLRVHRRATYLPRIIKQMKALAEGRRAYLVVRLDRPSPAVIGSLERAVADLPFEDTLFIPATTATRGGSNWAYSCEELWEATKMFCETDVAMLWDDDVLFSRKALDELIGHLDFFVHDHIDGRWAMCIYSEKQEDLNFPQHWAVAAFRCFPDDKWNTAIGQHAPSGAADSPRGVRLEHPLLHLGYLTDEDRRENWELSKASGKIDSHTLALTKEPHLADVQ